MSLALHAALNRDLQRIETRLHQLAAPAPDARHGDEADQRTARQDHEDLVIERARLERRRDEILAALVKFDRGDYGLCEQCTGPIGARRLAAMPTARLCLGCQAALEIRDEHFRRGAGLPMAATVGEDLSL